uniref:Fatty acyl-CoA reductase n=1 Tax=Heterorhabditis bacteriophora TaxID=37862 RepID=A0A1I7XBU8_HETBA
MQLILKQQFSFTFRLLTQIVIERKPKRRLVMRTEILLKNFDEKASTRTVHVYEPPVAPQKLMEAIEWMDDDMITLITPKLLGKRPNTYTLTKALAETLLVEDARQLPVVVIRPSIVGAMWGAPLPGWTDNINGPTGIFAAVGKGVLTNMCGSVVSKADIIPVDIVANMIIVGAAHRATTAYEEIPVMHCASGDLNPLKWEKVVNFLEQFYHKYPMDQCYAVPSTQFHTSRRLFELNYYLKHHIPAATMDMLNGLVGRKKSNVRLYGKVWKMIETLHYFTTHGWTFQSKALPRLWETLHPEDKKGSAIQWYAACKIFRVRLWCCFVTTILAISTNIDLAYFFHPIEIPAAVWNKFLNKVFNFDIRQVDWDSYLFDYVMGIKRFILADKVENIPRARTNLNK